MHLCTSEINLNQIEEGLKQWPADVDLHCFDFGLDWLSPHNGEVSTRGQASLPEDASLVSKGKTNGDSRMLPLMDYCCNEGPELMNVPHAFLGADSFGIPNSSLFASNPSHHLDQNYPLYSSLDYPNVSSSPPPSQRDLSVFNLGEKDIPGLIGMANMNAGSMFQAVSPMIETRENQVVQEDPNQVLDKAKLEELLHVLTGNKYRKKRRGKMGSGKHLTYSDLQKHFKLGLKEAAAELGICPTTLKRACRRNGIKRWPSRQTVKAGSEESTNQDEAPDLETQNPPPSENALPQSSSSLQQPTTRGRLMDTLKSAEKQADPNATRDFSECSPMRQDPSEGP